MGEIMLRLKERLVDVLIRQDLDMLNELERHDVQLVTAVHSRTIDAIVRHGGYQWMLDAISKERITVNEAVRMLRRYGTDTDRLLLAELEPMWCDTNEWKLDQ